MYPSLLAMILSGFFLLSVIVILLMKYSKGELKEMDQNTIILLLLGLCIGFGVHGLQHALAEIYFNFNPLEGKWCYRL